ncbi:MAG: type II CRISPR-associated endonuclease Cas1 [Armatimonadetes bacterium]|nr:type II CRISPR-associated endonuclease Cas1 [Armatimonadota bacterium]
MSHRFVEIEGPCRVSVVPGRLSVVRETRPEETFLLEDLAVVVLHGQGVLVTGEAFDRLAQHNVALVWCDGRHLPTSLTVPLAGHHQHARILRAQMEASLPTQKRLWQTLVRAKLSNQATALETVRGKQARKTVAKIRELSAMVRSGDPDNVEGVAAQLYWPAMFGEGFLRDPESPGLNAALNYAYAVLRACVARALVGAGLHPALGVFHRNLYNSFALADDVMEPLRPWVDLSVAEAEEEFESMESLTPPAKKRLLAFFVRRVRYEGRPVASPALLPDYAAAFRQALCRERLKLPVPEIPAGADSGPCGSS